MILDYRLPSTRLDGTRGAAEFVTRLGFGTLWSSERGADPFVTLASVPRQEPPLRIGTGIAVMAARSPYATAQASWQLAVHWGGRFILGLGTQTRAHVERRYGVRWESPAEWVGEYVAVLRAVWESWTAGHTPHYEGRYFRFTLTNPEFQPEGALEAPQLEIWLAAVTADAFRRAGRLADGVHIHAFHTPRYLREVALPAFCQAAGLPERTVIPATTPAFLGIAHDEAEHRAIRRAFTEHLGFYASTRSYLPVLEATGWAHVHEPCRALARAGRWDELTEHIPPAMFDEFASIGSAAEIADEGRRRYRGVISNLGLYRSGTRFMSDADWHLLRAAWADDGAGGLSP